MNWYPIALAVLSVCTALAIAGLIFDNKPEKRRAQIIMSVVLILGLNALSRHYILPHLNLLKAETDFESASIYIPALASIKRHDPQAYRSLIGSFADFYNQGYNQKQAAHLLRPQLLRFAGSRLPHASDETILAYARYLVAATGELKGQPEGLCYKFLVPEADESAEFGGGLSPATQNYSWAIIRAIYETSDSPRDIPSYAAVKPDVDKVYSSLRAKFGDDVSMLEDLTAAHVDKDKVCNIILDHYSEILKLPPQNAVNTLRWVFG